MQAHSKTAEYVTMETKLTPKILTDKICKIVHRNLKVEKNLCLWSKVKHFWNKISIKLCWPGIDGSMDDIFGSIKIKYFRS